VAVAYGSARGRPHHRWLRARQPRAPTAVAPTLPTATPSVLAARTAVGRAPPRMPPPSRLSVVVGPAALETAAPLFATDNGHRLRVTRRRSQPP